MTFVDDVNKAVKQMRALNHVLDYKLAPAAEAGALRFKAGAKQRVPKRTGDLEKSIGDREGEQHKGYAEHIVYSDLFYAPFVEYGHRGGLIVPDDANALQIGDDFVASAQAGSASPRPFFRSTADEDGNAIGRAITKRILQEVEKAL